MGKNIKYVNILKKYGVVEKRSDRILCIYYKSENRTIVDQNYGVAG